MTTETTPYLENDAVLSECGKYRYLLRRVWDWKKPRALICMLNPSTADARKDDATIRSCVRLLKAIGYGSLEVVNVFAFRATDPDELNKQSDPIGPDNEKVRKGALSRCDVAICGWGSHKMAAYQQRQISQVFCLDKPAVYCFGKTKSGSPKHPLYIKTGTHLETYP